LTLHGLQNYKINSGIFKDKFQISGNQSVKWGNIIPKKDSRQAGMTEKLIQSVVVIPARPESFLSCHP
jgi:hypothetical protein